MKVRQIMTSGSLATATLDTTLEEIANMMKAEDVGALPVLDDNEKLAGIITDRDIVVRAIAEGKDPTECTAEDILSELLHTIEPDTDVEDAVQLMGRHQIRRLPVVEDEQVIGIISLGDISVKSRQQDAGGALEDISAGVREQPGRNRQQQSGQESRGRERQSAAKHVAEEKTEYRRDLEDASIRGTPQMGSSRAESKLAGRVRNQSKSQQSVANDLVNAEGEEEPEFQNAGGGQARQRANQQISSARGRQQPAARGKDSRPVRGEGGARVKSGNAQGISNRSSRQENQRQQKVAPLRAEGKNARSQNKRRAS
jgi:CBS domain-containing protein